MKLLWRFVISVWIVATAIFAVAPRTTYAQTPPDPDPPALPAPDPAPSPAPTPPAPTPPADDDEDDDGPTSREDADNLVGFEQYGDYPLSHYEIGCDEGAWNHVNRKAWCAGQAWPFEGAKMMVGFANSVITWSLNFELADRFDEQIGRLATAYDQRIVGGLQLEHVMWLLACWWVAWLLLRQRTAEAMGELAMSGLAAAFGALLIANPAGYMGGAIDTIKEMNNTVLQATSGSDDGDMAAVVGAQLESSFVAAPYDIINWGRPLEGACADTRNAILELGAFGNNDTPRDMMEDAGCQREADFNHDPGMDRAAASIMLAGGSVFLTILMAVLAIVLMAAQFVLLPIWASVPIVMTLAIFRGTRSFAFSWAGWNATIFLISMAVVGTLAFVATSTTWVLQETSGISILQRMVLVDVMVIVGFILRKRLMKGATRAGRNLASKLNEITPGRRSADLMPMGAGGDFTGNNMRDRLRSAASDVPGGDRARRHMGRSANNVAQRVNPVDIAARRRDRKHLARAVQRRPQAPRGSTWSASKRRRKTAA